uniref:K(+)-transporting ATPase subunit C n=2 Tax=Calothrix sp. 336/3 TaxID=1337936 RepID=UPI0011875480|nr:K(+)-transporting ATPase subunit C [Calothrix sp. 336/3]
MIDMKNILKIIRMTVGLWVLTALIYPVVILAVSQVAFASQGNGSVLRNSQGTVIGSVLIGQEFKSERYFSDRPSTINYSQDESAKPTGVSGASNLAPSNPDLLKRVQEDASRLQQKNTKPVADLIYTSGSGLDPHISTAAAQAQLNRVAQARNLQPGEIAALIDRYTERRFLGIFGEPGVNVLELNYALDSRP